MTGKRFFDPPFVLSDTLVRQIVRCASKNLKRTVSLLPFLPLQKTAQELLQSRLEGAFGVACSRAGAEHKTTMIVVENGKFKDNTVECIREHFELPKNKKSMIILDELVNEFCIWIANAGNSIELGNKAQLILTDKTVRVINIPPIVIRPANREPAKLVSGIAYDQAQKQAKNRSKS